MFLCLPDSIWLTEKFTKTIQLFLVLPKIWRINELYTKGTYYDFQIKYLGWRCGEMKIYDKLSCKERINWFCIFKFQIGGIQLSKGKNLLESKLPNHGKTLYKLSKQYLNSHFVRNIALRKRLNQMELYSCHPL